MSYQLTLNIFEDEEINPIFFFDDLKSLLAFQLHCMANGYDITIQQHESEGESVG